MIDTLFGIKKNMTSGYDARGRRTGITLVEIQPNFITQIKSKDGKDGYNGVQLGIGEKKSVKKPQLGHLKKSKIENKIRWFREIKTDEGNLKEGETISLSQIFSIGDSVRVTGTSKGKGFQGGVRRHGFHGGPKTHGQSDRHRAPGAIGTGTTPGRVLKGKRMAGHMGGEGISTRNLEVAGIDKEKNLLLIKGPVPGFSGGLVQITKLGRIKGYTPPPEEKPDEDEEAESNDQEPITNDQTEEVKEGEEKENAS